MVLLNLVHLNVQMHKYVCRCITLLEIMLQVNGPRCQYAHDIERIKILKQVPEHILLVSMT